MRTKGQVTSFIIVGIMIILIASVVFFLRQSAFEDVDVLDYSPEDLSPIESYLVHCLDNSARNALLIIGMQGGYIELPGNIYSHPRTFLQTTQGGMKVPLWKIDGQEVFPDLRLVESQMETFIEKDIKPCVNALTEMDSLGDILFKSDPLVNVSINKEDVSFILNYEFEAEFENKFVTFEKFGVRTPVKLFDMLSTASYLINKNTEQMFLAETTVNILAMDPEIPLGDMKLECGKVRWSKNQVKAKLQDYLTYLMPSVRVSGTDFMSFSEPISVYEKYDEEWDFDRFEKEGMPDDVPVDMYQYLHHFWKLDKDFNGLNIGFMYDSRYGMNMQVSPSDGDKIEAEAGQSNSKYLRYLCLNIYHFTYDISYPLKVTLNDPLAFSGDGYSFSFGMPIFIEKNLPKTSMPNFFLMDARETDENFCSESKKNVVINAKDYFTGEYLSNVDIVYDCILLKCDLGTISSESNYGMPALFAKVPSACYGGFFIAEKAGYLRVKSQLPTDSGSIELDLLPLKEFSFGVYQLVDGVPVPYPKHYRATINIKSKNHDFEEYYTYPVLPGQTNKLHLLKGDETYDLEIYLFSGNNLVGGYVGDMSVGWDDIANSGIAFYAREFPSMGQGASPSRVMKLYDYLDEDPITDPYRQKYYPEFR